MAAKTGISWADKTWNPVVGCSLATPGCTNCYAMNDAHRIGLQPGKAGDKYRGLTDIVKGRPVWNGTVRSAGEEILGQPSRWRKPSMVFVNSMSDLFHEALDDEAIFRVLDAISGSRQHIYQILTKRSARMVEVGHRWLDARGLDRFPVNFWMGSSVEDQSRLDLRAPDMAVLRADVRWFSLEPLLGPLDIGPVLASGTIDWVVVGGESLPWQRRNAGENGRAFNVAWAVAILDACRAHGVAYHFKQLGENPVGATRTTSKGDRPEEWPVDLRVREWPDAISWLEGSLASFAIA